MAKASKPNKNAAASTYKNQTVATLLALAHGAPATMSFEENKSTARLFEIVVLADLLTTYTSAPTNGTAQVHNATGGELKFAGSPCSADKDKYSWFGLRDAPGAVENEAWVSVQFTTLSYALEATGAAPAGADKHEIDIGIFSPLAKGTDYPSYQKLMAGVSCKHFAPSKECVREALGLRRESAVLQGLAPSLVPWLVEWVPAAPASPMYLASSSPSVHNYSSPVEALGLYTASVPFK
ncbi:MAG: hypothetical protein HYX47_01965 [Burkholderiales bacterium]|nr:hypothetical protein [Burkholderiales bacterium]